jgi:hypothetical protein
MQQNYGVHRSHHPPVPMVAYLESHGFESLPIHTAHAAQNDDANSLKLRHNVASPFKQHCAPRVLSCPDSWLRSAANLGLSS